jgi:phenylalanyl-tRNA synthetase beta chain
MGIQDIYPEKLLPYRVGFSYSNCTALIGKEIDKGIIKAIIQNLGIEIENEGSDGLLLLVPRYKTDVTREADVIEEVMRIYGYNHIEVSKSISYTASHEAKNFDVALDQRAGELLAGFGFQEIMGLSLSKESYYDENAMTVKVVNPLSADLNVLRADMLYSGLEAIAYNVNRKNTSLKFFEIGKTYQQPDSAEAQYKEQKHLTLFVSGNLFQENPYNLNQEADFSFLKSAVNNLLHKCGVKNYRSSESSYSPFEFGMTYQLQNKTLVEMGSVSKTVLKKSGISQPVFYACIHWELLVNAFAKQKIIFEEISKFPAVKRDLALLIDKTIKYQQIEELAFSTERKLLKEVSLFDIYEGEKLGNKKSYAVRFTLLNNEATLTDKQIDAVMDKLISNYKEKLGAELR